MKRETDADVVIVGAGPSGIFTALGLLKGRPDARIVGVGFAEQEVPCGAIPLEPHDLPLPHVVSA